MPTFGFNKDGNKNPITDLKDKLKEAAAKTGEAAAKPAATATTTTTAAKPAAAATAPTVKPAATTTAAKPAGMPSNVTPGVQKPASTLKPVDTVAKEVIHGDWGNGADRKAKLEAAGYNYDTVQKRVNEMMGAGSASNLDNVARAVIRGEYGNGADRKAKLEAAGYDYNAVQARVNQIMQGGAPAPAADLDAVARAVIRGEYGNGAERKAKLEAAGYDFNAVQARVNQLLK